MTREERENALHCLRAMVEEEVCEECKLYGTTGTDHCEADCVRVAIEALKKDSKAGYISIDDVMSVFDDFMCGEVDEEVTETFLEMLKDKAESEGWHDNNRID